MLPLDGSELSFVFLFGFVGGLWSQRAAAAPAAFLPLQFAVLWPGFAWRADGATLPFLAAHAAAVWAGSAVGLCVAAFLASPRFLHVHDVVPQTLAVHAALAAAAAATTWVYVGLRAVLPPPWPSAAAAVAVAAAYCAAWLAWRLPRMYEYFPHVRHARQFAAASVGVHWLVLAGFGGADALLAAVPGAGGSRATGLALRCIGLATLTLVVLVVRFSPCYVRVSAGRDARLRPARSYRIEMLGDSLSDGDGSSVSVSVSSGSSSSAPSDDAVEYAGRPAAPMFA